MVAVILVTYNFATRLERCLRSVQTQRGVELRLYVVDNASSDGTVEEVRRLAPEAELMESVENLGFGAANNIGIRQALEAGADYVYLLNQDAWFLTPDDLANLVRVSERHPDYGILSPLQMNADGTTLQLTFAFGILTAGVKLDYHLLSDQLEGHPEDVYPLVYSPAAHWLLPRACLEKAGLFSPAFYHYGEDVNLSDRVWYHGLKCGVVTTVRGVHDTHGRPPTPLKNIYGATFDRAMFEISMLHFRKSGLGLRLAVWWARSWRENGHFLLHVRYAVEVLARLWPIYRYRRESKQAGAFVSGPEPKHLAPPSCAPFLRKTLRR